MTIIFRKKQGKPHAMQCLRNGEITNQTWQRSSDFYIMHDLVHYAIETILGLQSGFYGMLKSGISIHDFEGQKNLRPQLSRDAVIAETLAGTFQNELEQEVLENFNEVWQNNLILMGITEKLELSDIEITAIRTEIKRLLNLWKDTPVNSHLELVF